MTPVQSLSQRELPRTLYALYRHASRPEVALQIEAARSRQASVQHDARGAIRRGYHHRPDIAFASLYAGVVLLTARFSRTRGIIAAGVACRGLTALSLIRVDNVW